MVKIPRNKKSKNLLVWKNTDTIKILIKNNPFLKWVNFDECLLSILSSIVLLTPTILSGILTHLINQNYIILTGILSSIISNILFNVYVFRSINSLDSSEIKNDTTARKYNVPLIIQIPTSLLCIYISYIINPFLSYSIFILISSFLLMLSSYYDFIKSKYYSVKKHEIRDYRLGKIRKKVKL